MNRSGSSAARSRAATPCRCFENTRGGAETFPVVEDKDDVLDLAVHHLTQRGYRVLAARSGEEPLHVLEGTGGRLDLRFTDIVMPGGINGLVLAERARALFPGLRVLMTAGYNEDLAAGNRPAAAGGADVLGKLYGGTDLAARVRSAFNRRREGRNYESLWTAEG